MRKKRPLEERLWAKVEKSDGCWIWLGGTVRGGYGSIGTEGGKTEQTHRLSWRLANGEIPAGVQILHKCDTPRCVRPDHLYPGTNDDNVRDRTQRKRHWANRRPDDFKAHMDAIRWTAGGRGEKNSQALLTETQVREIRSSTERPTRLASRFGIKYATVWAIRARKLWKHVT